MQTVSQGKQPQTTDVMETVPQSDIDTRLPEEEFEREKKWACAACYDLGIWKLYGRNREYCDHSPRHFSAMVVHFDPTRADDYDRPYTPDDPPPYSGVYGFSENTKNSDWLCKHCLRFGSNIINKAWQYHCISCNNSYIPWPEEGGFQRYICEGATEVRNAEVATHRVTDLEKCPVCVEKFRTKKPGAPKENDAYYGPALPVEKVLGMDNIIVQNL
ncbi:hypothetical protein CC80DRAFT_556056 [Byssothecium circinans]|uniref:Uncharacterized protein n=1 Tax=Byssothecium circinans TaxID=147558 RepID=A0A6A5TD72_9PLEO|nr:hypothetical protein CC80DRAFT_556056 [Byssothecium circinans]